MGTKAAVTAEERRDAEMLKQWADELVRHIHLRDRCALGVTQGGDDAHLVSLLDSIVARSGRLMSRYRARMARGSA